MDVPGLRAQGRLPGVRHKPTICCLMQHRHFVLPDDADPPDKPPARSAWLHLSAQAQRQQGRCG